jgi:hypothetical protein
VAVLASNDPYVMSAWGKANGITDDSIVRAILYLQFPSLPPSFPRGFAGIENGNAGNGDSVGQICVLSDCEFLEGTADIK